MAVVVGCNDDDPKPLCIEEPCGSIIDDQTNLTVLNYSQSEITAMAITVEEETQLLSTEGWDFEEGKSFNCWQVVPMISNSSNVIFQYVLEGEEVIGFLSTVAVSSNTLVIEINGDDAALKSFEPCIDVQ